MGHLPVVTDTRVKNVEMLFEFKNTIFEAPSTGEQMYKQACQNDEITINTWRPDWIANAANTKKHFGSFADHGLGKLFGINKYKPCIVVGSGPSLKNNIEHLRDTKGIMVISCLHNFHYMVDNEVNVDYYVSLDAGPVVIEEIAEGGKKTAEEYREATRGKKLIAFIGSHPSLWENWLGEVYLFNCPLADVQYREAVHKLEPFFTYVSTGGNVLGACTYIARAIFGSNPIIFTGADFCFSYTRKFHPWESKYDANIGQAMRAIDVWGNSVLTWQSYYNFKIWFDWLCTNVPGLYINCTEGGILGSYPEGNLVQVKQMRLEECLWMYSMFEQMRPQCDVPNVLDDKILF